MVAWWLVGAIGTNVSAALSVSSDLNPDVDKLFLSVVVTRVMIRPLH